MTTNGAIAAVSATSPRTWRAEGYKETTARGIAGRSGRPAAPAPPNYKRRLVHLLAGLVLPAISLFLPLHIFLLLAWSVAGLLMAAEVARFASRRFNEAFIAVLRPFLRRQEKGRSIAASTYLTLASAVSFTVFPYPAAMTAVCFSAVGDAAAGALGERWGRVRIRQKSVEGSLAFLLASLGVGLLLSATVTHLGFLPMAVGALVGAAIELAPLPLNDNLSVPFACGITMSAFVWMGS